MLREVPWKFLLFEAPNLRLIVAALRELVIDEIVDGLKFHS
jgi:hypothetical protein